MADTSKPDLKRALLDPTVGPAAAKPVVIEAYLSNDVKTFGWHTRAVGILAIIGHVALIEQNPMVGDQGDIILRIGMIWLLLMHSSEVWSLDARRPCAHVVPLWFTNALHNIALCALTFQIVVIYIAASLFKLQGVLWRDGTALYYPPQLPAYRPFPWLSDLLIGNGLILGVATYAAVGIRL